MTQMDTDGGPQADGELGRIMITDSSDWIDVRRRTEVGKTFRLRRTFDEVLRITFGEVLTISGKLIELQK